MYLFFFFHIRPSKFKMYVFSHVHFKISIHHFIYQYVLEEKNDERIQQHLFNDLPFFSFSSYKYLIVLM